MDGARRATVTANRSTKADNNAVVIGTIASHQPDSGGIDTTVDRGPVQQHGGCHPPTHLVKSWLVLQILCYLKLCFFIFKPIGRDTIDFI